MLWKQVIDALVKYPTPYGHLKPAILAQWMLESGRGTSEAFKNYLNVAGMKWRDEMRGFAERVWYKTDTEGYRNGPNGWEKGDWFCKFNTPEDAVAGYFRFLGRPPYHGWEQHTKDAEEFLSFIGQTWCPVRYEEDHLYEGGLNYHQYILSNLYEEAKQLLNAAGHESGDTPTLEATWFEANRKDDGTAVISAMTKEGKSVSNLVGSPAIATKTAAEFLAHFKGAGTFLTAETNKKVIPEAPEWPEVRKPTPEEPPRPTGKKLAGKKFLLDPGHSPSNPGTSGRGRNPPKEYEMNVIQAKIIADILRDEGAFVRIYDPDPDSLERVGLAANGMDCYVSIHHNSANADGTDEGTETFVHPRASKDCISLASKVNAAIVKALGTKNRGVKKAAYTVLSTSHYDTDCRYNILTESYFLDDYSSIELATWRSSEAARAIAAALIAYFDGLADGEEQPTPEPGVLKPWSGVRTFKRGEDLQLTKNFHLSELECRCGCGTTKVNGDHIQNLQNFRDRLGKPIRINSGYRCPAYNKKIDGARNSQHIYGCATDIVVDGMNPKSVQNEAEVFDGLGRYRTFTHVDSRGYKARWNG